jgi:hypothetical protein
VENRELKYNMEDLILELKLHERKQELDGLLTYEDRIGTQTYSNFKNAKNSANKSHLGTFESKGSELPNA